MRWIIAIATLLASRCMVNAVPEAGTQAVSPEVLSEVLHYAKHAAAADCYRRDIRDLETGKGIRVGKGWKNLIPKKYQYLSAELDRAQDPTGYSIKDLLMNPLEITSPKFPQSYTAGYTGVDKETGVFVVAFWSPTSVQNFARNGEHSQAEFPEGAKSMVNGLLLDCWKAARKSVLQTIDSHSDPEIFVTGYGVAGGVAALAAEELRAQERERALSSRRGGKRVTLITFGSVMVGNEAFANAIAQEDQGHNFRVVYGVDPVPNIPKALHGDLPYQHGIPEFSVSESADGKIHAQLRHATGPKLASLASSQQDLDGEAFDDHRWYPKYARALSRWHHVSQGAKLISDAVRNVGNRMRSGPYQRLPDDPSEIGEQA